MIMSENILACHIIGQYRYVSTTFRDSNDFYITMATGNVKKIQFFPVTMAIDVLMILEILLKIILWWFKVLPSHQKQYRVFVECFPLAHENVLRPVLETLLTLFQRANVFQLNEDRACRYEA